MKEYFDKLLEKGETVLKVQLALLRLTTINKISNIFSETISVIAFSTLLFITLLNLNLGVAFWLGSILGEIYFGFFLVAAFYFLLFLVLWLFFKKPMIVFFKNSIIKKLIKLF